MSACKLCIPLKCVSSGPLGSYSLQGGTFFTNPEYYFVLFCPPGYYCQPGVFPIIVRVGPRTLPTLTIPPIDQIIPGMPLVLKCCLSDVVRQVPTNATTVQLMALVQSMFAECAAQQARCNAFNSSASSFDFWSIEWPEPLELPKLEEKPEPGKDFMMPIGNDVQSYTAVCPAGTTGDPVTVTVPADTFFHMAMFKADMTEEQIQGDIDFLRSYFNILALAKAETDANEAVADPTHCVPECAGYCYPYTCNSSDLTWSSVWPTPPFYTSTLAGFDGEASITPASGVTGRMDYIAAPFCNSTGAPVAITAEITAVITRCNGSPPVPNATLRIYYSAGLLAELSLPAVVPNTYVLTGNFNLAPGVTANMLRFQIYAYSCCVEATMTVRPYI